MWPQPPRKSTAPAGEQQWLLTWAILFGATCLAYWPALFGTRVWDDNNHITAPGLQSLHGLWRIWFDLGATQQYYPLLHSAFWLEHRLWGDAVFGYHLTNVALHAACAALVVFLVRRLALPGAWLAGFLFALHPVCVEGVAWISEQKSTLSGVFCLAAALVYLHFDRERRTRTYVLATGLFVLALLSKSVTATLPVTLLVILWWQHGRLDWRRDVTPLLPWLAIGAAGGLFTAWVERSVIGAQGAGYDLSLAQHVLLAGRIPWFYAGKLLWPAGLAFSYPRWTIDPAVWWQYLYPAAAVGLATALVILARRMRGPLASALVFLATLFPVLGFLSVFPFRYAWVADHFQYLASLAILIPAAGLLTGLRLGKAASVALPTVLTMMLGILTWQQSGIYRDEETLYTETLASNPESGLAHTNLGIILAQKPGRLTDAIAEYRAAIRSQPENPEAHNNLGSALAHSGVPGSLEEALGEYQTALRLKPDFAEAHLNLGNALSRRPGRLADAIAEYQAALKIDPESALTHANLGNALAQTPGRLTEAIDQYQTAVRLLPDSAWIYVGLGDTLAQIPERLPEAVAQYQTALRIDPNSASAHLSLAIAWSQMPQRKGDAIAECQLALQLDPSLELAQRLLQHLKSGQE